MSADPFKQAADVTDSGSWNKYSYTRGDPINRKDPAGLADFYAEGVAFHCEQTKEGCPDGNNDNPSGGAGDVDNGSSHGGGGGGGGGSSTPSLNRFRMLSADCQKGLTDAVSTGNMSPEIAAGARLAALDRANASASVIQNAVGDSVDWAWVAAIGIRESGFRNLSEIGGGLGLGY